MIAFVRSVTSSRGVGRIEVEVSVEHVREDRCRARVHDHVRGRRPGDRGRDHLVTGPDSEGDERQVQRGGSGRDRQHVLGLEVLREAALELGGPRPGRQPAGAERLRRPPRPPPRRPREAESRAAWPGGSGESPASRGSVVRRVLSRFMPDRNGQCCRPRLDFVSIVCRIHTPGLTLDNGPGGQVLCVDFEPNSDRPCRGSPSPPQKGSESSVPGATRGLARGSVTPALDELEDGSDAHGVEAQVPCRLLRPCERVVPRIADREDRAGAVGSA